MQLVEQLAVQTVFVLDDGAFADVGDGEGGLPDVVSGLLLGDGAAEVRLHGLAVHEIEGGGLQVFDALVSVDSHSVLGEGTCGFLIEGIGRSTNLDVAGTQRELRGMDTGLLLWNDVVGNSDLGIARSLGFEYLDAELLVVVYEIALHLHSIFDVGQTAQHHGVGIGVSFVDGHLQLFFGGLAKLHVNIVLCRSGQPGTHAGDE